MCAETLLTSKREKWSHLFISNAITSLSPKTLILSYKYVDILTKENPKEMRAMGLWISLGGADLSYHAVHIKVQLIYAN